MRLDVDLYKASKKIGQDWYIREGHKDSKSAISIMSFLTGVPCLVAVCWVSEIDGWTDDLIETFIILSNFYGYTEVLNLPDNCPQELIKVMK